MLTAAMRAPIGKGTSRLLCVHNMLCLCAHNICVVLRKFWRGIFVAFDILTYGDQHAMRLPFAKRLDLLNSNVMSIYDNKTKGAADLLHWSLSVTHNSQPATLSFSASEPLCFSC